MILSYAHLKVMWLVNERIVTSLQYCGKQCVSVLPRTKKTIFIFRWFNDSDNQLVSIIIIVMTSLAHLRLRFKILTTIS